MFRALLLLCAILLLNPQLAGADESLAATALREQFNHRYQNYFGPDSQALLPFPRLEMPDWKKIVASRPLKRIYTEPDKRYNSKVYSFTLYQAADDGSFYLDAKGGFWGMDELVYGPIGEKELQ